MEGERETHRDAERPAQEKASGFSEIVQLTHLKLPLSRLDAGSLTSYKIRGCLKLAFTPSAIGKLQRIPWA